MDYKSMTKEQLIELIEEMKQLRAFTYEDRMKLRIIDEAPFTLWACDRDFRIRLWECEAPSMYSIRKDEAIGRKYLELFVAPDERAASEEDCIDIIEKGKEFHNSIAEDSSRRGKCTVITNCFRVQDVDTGEWLQAEIGLDISNLDEEKEKYNRVIAESKQIREDCDAYTTKLSRSVDEARSTLAEYQKLILTYRREIFAKNANRAAVFMTKSRRLRSRLRRWVRNGMLKRTSSSANSKTLKHARKVT